MRAWRRKEKQSERWTGEVEEEKNGDQMVRVGLAMERGGESGGVRVSIASREKKVGDDGELWGFWTNGSMKH